MIITKKINNNVALGLDSKGKEIVIFGKGIGFHEIPYELVDLTLVTKTYYDIEESYLGLLDEIPENILNVSFKISEYAKNKVNCELNPNLPITLADHINFAIERFKKSIDITNPLANDIKHLYKLEMEIGNKGLEFIRKDLKLILPKIEAASIAIHIINAESGHNDMDETIRLTKILKEVTKIIEDSFNIEIDKESLDYSRFVIHLKYFIQRVEKNEIKNSNDNNVIFESLKIQYPDTYSCFKKIDNYFKQSLKWEYNDDEQLYIMVHINRLLSK